MFETAAKGKFDFEPSIVNGLTKFLGTELFLTKTVGELISGYKDPLLALGKMFLPEIIKDDKFSLINGVNLHSNCISMGIYLN